MLIREPQVQESAAWTGNGGKCRTTTFPSNSIASATIRATSLMETSSASSTDKMIGSTLWHTAQKNSTSNKPNSEHEATITMIAVAKYSLLVHFTKRLGGGWLVACFACVRRRAYIVVAHGPDSQVGQILGENELAQRRPGAPDGKVST